MMASWIGTGTPQRSSDRAAASSQSGFSANTEQRSSGFLGRVVPDGRRTGSPPGAGTPGESARAEGVAGAVDPRLGAERSAGTDGSGTPGFHGAAQPPIAVPATRRHAARRRRSEIERFAGVYGSDLAGRTGPNLAGGMTPHGALDHRIAGLYGRYQMGEVQARSWTTGGTSAMQQARSPGGTDCGFEQSTPARTQICWLQRHVGFSSTRT